MTVPPIRNRPIAAPLSPLEIISTLRWLGELDPDEIVAAIRAGANAKSNMTRDLSPAQRAEMVRLAEKMSTSRLRAWKGGEDYESRPSWLHVRALIAGLHEILE